VQARGLGPPQPLPLPLAGAGETRKVSKAQEPKQPADLLPCAGTVNISYLEERESAREDVRLLLARESCLVGDLVLEADDHVSIQRLKAR
jgi:hypothetical protein